jgi:hypothetical protein
MVVLAPARAAKHEALAKLLPTAGGAVGPLATARADTTVPGTPRPARRHALAAGAQRLQEAVADWCAPRDRERPDLTGHRAGHDREEPVQVEVEDAGEVPAGEQVLREPQRQRRRRRVYWAYPRSSSTSAATTTSSHTPAGGRHMLSRWASCSARFSGRFGHRQAVSEQRP